MASLTPEQVHELRFLYATGAYSIGRLAKLMGLGKGQVQWACLDIDRHTGVAGICGVAGCDKPQFCREGVCRVHKSPATTTRPRQPTELQRQQALAKATKREAKATKREARDAKRRAREAVSLAFRSKQKTVADYPGFLAEWHATKNVGLSPDKKGIWHRKVWWLCACGREWQASLQARARREKTQGKCGECRRLDSKRGPFVSECELLPDWHTEKNAGLDPSKVKTGSGDRVWWRCKGGHSWQASPRSRWAFKTPPSGERHRPGCPRCARIGCTVAERRPDLAREWHPANAIAADKTAIFGKDPVRWSCSTCSHDWIATPMDRAMSSKASFTCPECLKVQASRGDLKAKTKLARGVEPRVRDDEKLAQLYHPTKNGPQGAARALLSSRSHYWWKCSEGHEWRAAPLDAREGCPTCKNIELFNSDWAPLKPWWDPTNGPVPLDAKPPRKVISWQCPQGHQIRVTGVHILGKGCPQCVASRRRAPLTLDLSAYPDLIREYAPENGQPATAVMPMTYQKWTCRVCGHAWKATAKARIKHLERPGRRNSECLRCKSIAGRFPVLAAEWHPSKNGDRTPWEVDPQSNAPAWWKCPKGHEWEAPPVSRVGKIEANKARDRTYIPGSRQGNIGDLIAKTCPECFTGWGWTLEAVRDFVKGLLPWVSTLSPAEMVVLFEQNGFSRAAKSRGIAEAIVKGASASDLESFVRGDCGTERFTEEELPEAVSHPSLGMPTRTPETEPRGSLPRPTASGILRSSAALPLSDGEAAKALLQARKARLWALAYQEDGTALSEVESFHGDDYANRIRDAFLDEYRAVQAVVTPASYSFRVSGVATPPNLMQRHTVWRLSQERRMGNWSDTGAGKSNAAILASRVLEGVHFTLVVCPNNVVETWISAITQMFPDSDVASRTLDPCWRPASQHRYLVLNYEVFQKRAPLCQPDLVVLDEVQLAKQRIDDQTSNRREFLEAFLEMLEARKRPYVLSMSATPVINNLREGKSILELTLGRTVEGPIAATTSHCLRQHRQFIDAGVRWVPNFDLQFEERIVEAPCDSLVPEILALPRNSSTLDLERLLTRARLPLILDNLQPKTIVYTYNVDGITDLLHRQIANAGWSVGFYTGEDKTGLEGFLNGTLDVLVASQAITLGIDGLQHVCNRIILNVLPWTYAEYKQLKGRVFRQGQRRQITLILPIVSATVGGSKWSWDEAKLGRLRFKQTIGDAVLDGTLPHGRLQTAADAFSNAMAWLRRLETKIQKAS